MSKKHRIALALAAKSGAHKQGGRAFLEYAEQFKDKYEVQICFTGFDADLMARQVSQLAKEGVDIIFTIGHIFTRIAINVLSKMDAKSRPAVVFTGVKWPVEQGLIDSTRRPGGCATGVVREGASPLMPAYFIKSLGFSIKKILIPYSVGSEGGYLAEQAKMVKNFLEEDSSMKVTIVPIEHVEVAPATVEVYLGKGHDFILCLEGCMLSSLISPLSALCHEYGAYLFGDGPEAIRMGADFAYGGNDYVFSQRAFRLIRKICENGLAPGEVPLTRVRNNRSYWVNSRLLDRKILTRDDVRYMENHLNVSIKWIDTVVEELLK